VPRAARHRAQPPRVLHADGGLDRGRLGTGRVGLGQHAVRADQLEGPDPRPLDAGRDRQPSARLGLEHVARAPAVDAQLQPRSVGGHRAAGPDRLLEGGDRQRRAAQVGVDPGPPRRVGDQRAPRVGEPDVGAGGGGQPQPAVEQVVVEDGGALGVVGAQQVHRVDQAEGGVGHQLAGLHRPREAEGLGRGAVAQGREDGMGVADRGARPPQLLARRRVGRPVDRLVGGGVAGGVAGRRPRGAEGVEVPEQVVAVLDPEAGHAAAAGPGQVAAGGELERLAVVHQGAAEVGGHQAHEVQALAQLHAGRVVGEAHQVARVVHVDVEVAAVPAAGGGVVQPRRPQLDVGRASGLGRDRGLGDAELRAPGAGDGEGHGGDVDQQVVAVEHGAAVGVPLARPSPREPGAAVAVDHRPAARRRRPQPQPGGRGALAGGGGRRPDRDGPGVRGGQGDQLDAAGLHRPRDPVDLDPGRPVEVGVEQHRDLDGAARDGVGPGAGPQPDPAAVQRGHDQAGGERVGEAAADGGGPVLPGEHDLHQPGAEPAGVGLPACQARELVAPVVGALGLAGAVALQHGRHRRGEHGGLGRVAAHAAILGVGCARPAWRVAARSR
jgi:hypothetical protein